MVYNYLMAIRICVLGSGSKGNSILVDNGKNRLLIDAGLAARDICFKLAQIDVDINTIDGILVTHEHNDHIRGLEALSKKIPVYAHDYTMEVIAAKCDISLERQMHFDNNMFSVGSLDVQTFRISHDAVYPLGFCISDCDSKITYATDMGYCSKEFLKIAKGSDLVLIESNHDVDMLINGSYPAYLKKRIISNKGHLSNIACAMAINELAESGTRHFVLSHLSENNNLPELAYWTNADYLRRKGAKVGEDVKLYVAEQWQVSGYIGNTQNAGL